MEKQRVNDAVVRLGNLIGKGRTHIVHRISSKIRDFRKKDEKKFEQRIQRLLREIAFLKTLTNSRSRKLVSRKILLSEEDHVAKIELEATTPEDRAFHRLCKEKCIANYVSKFREDNIDWKYWMPPLLEMWQKKLELKEQRSKKNGPDKDNKKQRPSIKEIVGEKTLKRQQKESDDSSGEQDSESEREEVSASRKKTTSHDETTRETQKMTNKNGNVAKKLKTAQMPKAQFSKSKENHLDESEASSDDADEEVVFNWKSDPAKLRVAEGDSSEEENSETGYCDRNDDDEEDDDDGEGADNNGGQQPFRPYAPKHTGSTASEDEEEDEEDNVEDKRIKSDHGDRDGAKVQVEDEGSDDEDDEDNEGSEESSDQEEQMDESGEEEEEDDEDSDEDSDGEDSEDEEEIKRKRKLLLGGSDKSKTKELQIDFSVQKKLDTVTKDLDDPAIREKAVEKKMQKKIMKRTSKIESGKTNEAGSTAESSSSESDDESDEGASFFVKEGETAKEIPSKTIPKEKAPGLNRRERRGNLDKKTSNSDDGDVEYGQLAGNRDRAFGGFQNASQDRSDRFQGGRPSRGRGSFNGQGGRSSFPNRFSQDARGGHHGRGENGAGRGGFRGGRNSHGGGNDRESFGRFNRGPRENAFQGGGRDSGTNERPFRDGQNGQYRTSFGGFNRNSRNDFPDRRSFGGQRGRGQGNWTPRGGGRGIGDDHFAKGDHREVQKPFQNEAYTPRDMNKSSNTRTPAGSSGASFQKGFQGSDRQRTADNGRNIEGSSESLHPSWAAKKRQSVSINQPFQGKKIVFSED